MANPDPLLARIIAHLAAERERRGIPRSAIARQAGVGWHTVRFWEVGDHIPRADGLAAYARALGYQLTIVPLKADRPGGQPTEGST